MLGPVVRPMGGARCWAYHVPRLTAHPAPANSTSGPVIGIFHEWRLANRLAAQAESVVLAGLMRVLDRRGDAATDEEVARAKHLREVANDLFETGMKEMAARANSLKR
jgi:hypothetical protein